MNILLAVVFIALLIGAFFRPFIALAGLFAVLSINPGELSSILAVIHIERLMECAAIASLVLHTKSSNLFFGSTGKRLIVFWAVMLLSVPTAVWPGAALQFCFNYLGVVLLGVMLINVLDEQKQIERFIAAFVLFIGWIALSGLWGYANGQIDPNAALHGLERAQGLTSSNSNPNALGMTLVSGLPFVLLMLAAVRGWKRVFTFFVLGASVATVVLTASRTSFALLLTLIFLYCLTRKKGILLLPVGIIAAVIVWSLLPQVYRDRYTSIIDVTSGTKEDESLQARKLTRQAGLKMFADNPITGVGAGQFGIANGTKYWPGPGRRMWYNAHNLYLQLAGELGLLGLFAWFAFILPSVREAFRLRRGLRDRPDLPVMLRYLPSTCLFCFFVLFVSGYTGHNLYRTIWVQLAGMLAALSAVTRSGQPVDAATDPSERSDDHSRTDLLVDGVATRRLATSCPA